MREKEGEAHHQEVKSLLKDLYPQISLIN